MQPIQILQMTLEKHASSKSFLFSAQDFYSIFSDFTIENLRSDVFNYISQKTVLCEASVISQQLMEWITIVTKGRSGIIEFVHTQKDIAKIASELTLDTRCGMFMASVKQALIDMKDAKRPLDLIEQGERNE